jgi:hypothetical protein
MATSGGLLCHLRALPARAPWTVAPSLIVTIPGIIFALKMLLSLSYSSYDAFDLLEILAAVVASVVVVFAIWCWAIGTSTNFTLSGRSHPHSLTRLDAIYFAAGTLTSAGTGNIYARSELATAVQGVQMTVDLVLFVLVVTVVVLRYNELRKGGHLS